MCGCGCHGQSHGCRQREFSLPLMTVEDEIKELEEMKETLEKRLETLNKRLEVLKRYS